MKKLSDIPRQSTVYLVLSNEKVASFTDNWKKHLTENYFSKKHNACLIPFKLSTMYILQFHSKLREEPFLVADFNLDTTSDQALVLPSTPQGQSAGVSVGLLSQILGIVETTVDTVVDGLNPTQSNNDGLLGLPQIVPSPSPTPKSGGFLNGLLGK